ncbi:MAG TPA: permease-like cell division protein FtsX [Bacillales bacterium]|nr:permease-like cell division protein FtsX [Bacillales bacterium]
MKLRTLGRHGKEGLKNLGRNGWMTFASISSVTVALLLVGFFMALMLNLNHITDKIKDDVEVKAYISRTATQQQVDQLREKISSLPLVGSVDFVSKEEGLQQLIESMSTEGEPSPVLESLKNENPLPDSFVIKPKRPEDTIKIAEKVKTFENLSDVRAAKDTVRRLLEVTSISRNIGLVLIVGLLFTTVFLIGNTIKLTIVSRRREIEIMKLVGATNGFIRWPFFVEGLSLGILGSVLPVTLLLSAYQSFYHFFYTHYATTFIELIPVNPQIYLLSTGLVMIGAVIGVWGSITSVRKFLRI